MILVFASCSSENSANTTEAARQDMLVAEIEKLKGAITDFEKIVDEETEEHYFNNLNNWIMRLPDDVRMLVGVSVDIQDSHGNQFPFWSADCPKPDADEQYYVVFVVNKWTENADGQRDYEDIVNVRRRLWVLGNATILTMND